jgi:hypothetical protein
MDTGNILEKILDECTEEETEELLREVMERVQPETVDRLVKEYRGMVLKMEKTYWEDYARRDF